jgi:hypothetical protein
MSPGGILDSCQIANALIGAGRTLGKGYQEPLADDRQLVASAILASRESPTCTAGSATDIHPVRTSEGNCSLSFDGECTTFTEINAN